MLQPFRSAKIRRKGSSDLPVNPAGQAEQGTAGPVVAARMVIRGGAAQTVTVSDPTPVDKATKTVLSVQGEAKVGLPVDLFATVSEDPSDALVPSGGTVQFKIGGVDQGAPVAGSGQLPPESATRGSLG